MINRILLRIKIVQIVFSFYKNEKKNEIAVENELLLSLEQTYNLYHLLLQLAVEITDYAKERIERGKNKLRPTDEELNPNTRFIDNTFVKQLASNTQLKKYLADKKISWAECPDVIESAYKSIISADYYAEYMSDKSSSYKSDKDLWRKIFRKTILTNDALLDTLEDMNLYWNDDVDIVISFLLKTIKQFEEDNGSEQALLPMFKDEEDKEFAIELLLATLKEKEKYRTLIDKHSQNWEFDRIAFMDIIIMQIALSEIFNFPAIPVNVTLNEYIEISKTYSTERSGAFINGVLDKIVDELKSDNKITKVLLYKKNK